MNNSFRRHSFRKRRRFLQKKSLNLIINNLNHSKVNKPKLIPQEHSLNFKVSIRHLRIKRSSNSIEIGGLSNVFEFHFKVLVLAKNLSQDFMDGLIH